MRVKYIRFSVESTKLVESRINEELKGWKITKLIYFGMEEVDGNWVVDFIGEINE